MSNPYLINGPALVSFSGGKTSAFMMHEILRAHGGTLPDGWDRWTNVIGLPRVSGKELLQRM
jgi:hypothetical protein